MRWFKHISVSHSDEKISKLLDKFGPIGYGVWWLILEKIAQQMDNSDKHSIQLSIRTWSKYCRISSKKFQILVGFLQKIGLFSLEYEDDYLSIKCPNLLKYRDEWTNRQVKNGKKTQEQLGSDSGVTREQEAEADTDTEVTKVDMSAEASKLSTPRHPNAALDPSLRKTYFDELEKHFSALNPTSSKLFRMLIRWEDEKVSPEDIRNAMQCKKGEKITAPWYYENVVIEFAQARLNGRDPPTRKLSVAEHNAIVIKKFLDTSED